VERATGLAAWAQDGLDQHERLVCSELPGSSPGAAPLVEVLERAGVPAADAVATGALDVVPSGVASGMGPGTTSAPWIGARLAAALEAGFTGLRICLDVPAGAGDGCAVSGGSAGGLGYGARLAILCRHDRTARRSELEAAIAAHPEGLRTAMLVTRPIGEGLAVAGEVDVSNVDLFAATLAFHSRAARSVLWLDVANLRFMDVAGCRALARVTRVFRNNGGTLLVVDPLPPVAHVLRLLGVDRLRGLEVLGA
jgi:anti-anti-sigma factor